MLGSEHPHGRPSEVEFGSDWPVCRGQRSEAQDRQQLYGWVERVLVVQKYAELHRIAHFCGVNNSTALMALPPEG